MAKECGARGFTAVKMNATEEMQFVDSHAKVDAVLERVGAIREAMGPHFGIGVDFHGRVHRPMAKVIAKELGQRLLEGLPISIRHRDIQRGGAS